MNAQRDTIFSADFGSSSVRFVRSPLHGIDVPWVVVADMLAAAQIKVDDALRLIGTMRSASPMRSIKLGASIEQIAPPWTLVLLCEELNVFGSQPRRAVVAAFAAAYPDLPPETRALALLQCPSATPDGDAS